jgi:outer membrane protein
VPSATVDRMNCFTLENWYRIRRAHHYSQEEMRAARTGTTWKQSYEDRLKRQLVVALMICSLWTQAAAFVEYDLQDLYKLALERSERIKISGEDVYIAGANRDKARSYLLPKLSAFGSQLKYSQVKISDTGNVTQPLDQSQWGLRLDQAVTLNGKEAVGYRIAKDNVQRSRYDLLAVKEAYMLSVSGAYYDFLHVKKLLQISRANVDRLTKYKEAAETRLKVGEVTKTAVLRAEAELSGARSDLIKTENLLKLSKASLARIVGIQDEDFDVREGVITEESDAFGQLCWPLTAECLKAKANDERAELKSLRVQRKVAEEQIKYVSGGYWPTLSAEGVYQRTVQTPELTNIIRDLAYGGLRLTFPFFEGGLRVAEVSEAYAKKRQIDYTYEDSRKSVGIEVDSAYLDLITQKGVLRSLEDQFTFARDNYNAILKQFVNGLANSIDVMDANTLLVTAERQFADAVYNYQQAILKVKRAAGTLLESLEGSGTDVQSKSGGLSSSAKGEAFQ